MKIETAGERIFNALQNNAELFSSMNDELKGRMKAFFDSQANNLGLVTHEELAVLRASLNRANERIQKLEQQLNNV